jgi:UDP-glucose 4-epimerase
MTVLVTGGAGYIGSHMVRAQNPLDAAHADVSRNLLYFGCTNADLSKTKEDRL